MRAATLLALALARTALGIPLIDFDALAAQLAREHPEIPQEALARAFGYLSTHYAPNSQYVAIADLSRPSNQRRLSVIRLTDGRVESFLVAHGEESGGLYAVSFSDEHRSHMSALGIYLTGPQYDGRHGRSMKLLGMEGSNREAESREVVLHGAAYVSDEYVREHGEAGRSWGCPAVDYRYRDHIINELEGGAVLLLYHSGSARPRVSAVLST